MAINTYDKGDTVRLSSAFTSDGVPADPTDAILKIKKPDGTIETYKYSLAEVTKESTGNYYRDVLMSQIGQLWYHWEGTGAIVTAGESYVVIRPSEFD
jgi:hypothetical protein